MTILIKILFYILAGTNGLIGLIFFFGALASIISPRVTYSRASDSYVVATGCLLMLCLLGWAYYLAMVQGRMGAGFGMVALSYLGWIGIQVTIIIILSSKGGWSWQ